MTAKIKENLIKRKILTISAGVFLIGFLLFSFYIQEQRLQNIDIYLTFRLQELLPRSVDGFFSVFSLIGTAEITVLIWSAIASWLIYKRYYLTLLFTSLFFIGVMFETIGKLMVYHPAPPYILYRGIFHFDLPSHFVQTTSSYPSGHMFRTAYLTLFLIIYIFIFLKGRLKYFYMVILFLILFIMAVSRIYLGEHWASDVVGGILLGVSFGLLSAASLPVKYSGKS